jgi:hypothetical protein
LIRLIPLDTLVEPNQDFDIQTLGSHLTSGFWHLGFRVEPFI